MSKKKDKDENPKTMKYHEKLKIIKFVKGKKIIGVKELIYGDKGLSFKYLTVDGNKSKEIYVKEIDGKSGKFVLTETIDKDQSTEKKTEKEIDMKEIIKMCKGNAELNFLKNFIENEKDKIKGGGNSFTLSDSDTDNFIGGLKKSSKKASRKTSRKAASKKTSRKASKKISRRKASRKASSLVGGSNDKSKIKSKRKSRKQKIKIML
jgi:hypothetical protein